MSERTMTQMLTSAAEQWEREAREYESMSAQYARWAEQRREDAKRARTALSQSKGMDRG